MYPDRMMPTLHDLLASVGWEDAPVERLEVTDNGLALATPWPVTANALAVLAAVGLASSCLREQRGGGQTAVRLDTRQAGLAMANSSYLTVDGTAAKFRDPFTGIYEAADDRHVFLHGNFPHLREGLMRMLGATDLEGVRARARERDAFGIEADAIAGNWCAGVVRSRAEWLGTLQAAAVRALPLLEIRRIGDAPPRRMPAGEGPLGGLRMLDLSRVIAGPMAGRTFAEHGGEVLLVSGPQLPFIQSLVIDTGFGKRSATIDLSQASGRSTFSNLLASADVLMDAYRPGALAAKGYSPDELAASRPGIIHVDLTAFSRAGPWRMRRGYDSLVQATSGMCWRDDGSPPKNLPCQPLDYLSGYLAAFGIMLCLLRQMDEGGTWSVALSLARTAEWMWDTYEALGQEQGFPAQNPASGEVADLRQDYATAFGVVGALKPPLQDAAWRWARPPVPLGNDAPVW
ncbi:CoA transferase [Agaricicola taiwanensis]|uniref:CoA transferase n=1 Tax=Agaricicola taiwanensis TaxID=591372 RepID=A0A8J2VSY8_9RHOB|nr:CoA transferase [Agaricicola taiwanensis]GGE37856.1 CoA transferase [Agaricicola taiwanensis]